MTTSSTAIFIPFMTRELRMAGPSLYYGMNALSHNVIMADRKKLKSATACTLAPRDRENLSPQNGSS